MYKSFTIIVLIVLFALFSPLNYSAIAEFEEPVGFYSSVYLLPDYSEFMNPDYLFIDVIIEPDGKEANSASIMLDFPEESLQVVNFNYNDDFCKFFGDQIIDNDNGYINLSCGNFDAVATSSTSIARFTFKKLSAGNAKFDLSGSSLHAHDGFGTDFLSFTGVHNIYLYR